MISDIIKHENLICTEKQFQEYLDTQKSDDELQFDTSKGFFTENFEGHMLNNPTSDPNAMWYALEEKKFNYRYLQTQAPGTGEMLDANNIETIMDNHISDLENEHHHSIKLQKTIKHFKDLSESYYGKRARAYKPVKEQLDQLWHAVRNNVPLGDSDWFNDIQDIKEKYPKGVK